METVKVGNHVLPVVPQRHARLRHQLSVEDFQSMMSGDYGHHSYRVLCILIPALKDVPEHEWEGFQTKEAWKADDYDELLDLSPTTAEIVNAFEKALMVSGAGRLGKILELVRTGQSLTAQGQEVLTPAVVGSDESMESSPDSPGSNGAST